MNQLFCYGTLQVPEVIHAVTGRTYKGEPATLPGYAIYRVKNTEYPGIIRLAGNQTKGIIYPNVSDKELSVLDLFEGDYYRRQLLDVFLAGGDQTSAWVYVIKDDHLGVLTDECWNLEDFLDRGLESFMQGYVHGRRSVYSS